MSPGSRARFETPGQHSAASPQVAFVHLMGDFDTVPLLRSAVTLLARRGYRVDVVYVRDPDYLPPQFDSPQVRLVPVTRLPQRWPPVLRRTLEAPLWMLQVLRAGWRSRYLCLFGVDPVGLIVAGVLGALTRSPLAYISLELYLSHEMRHPLLRLMKLLERIFNRRARFTLVQDEQRADLLSIENGIARSEIVLVPNAPSGPARCERTDYLQRRLGLGDDQIIVLHAGTLTEWTATPEMIESARTWPPGWTLVLHSRQRQAELEPEVLEAGPTVRLSSGPVPYAELPALVSSAHIGLALYRNLESVWHGDNLTHIGLSSGKLAQYLLAGLPVVVSALPGLTELVADYRCGVCVRSVGEIKPAIETILRDYDRYSQGALRCFAEVFDFEQHFKGILARLRLEREPGND